MPHRIIANSTDRDAFIAFLGNLKLPFTVEWTLGRSRSLEQNHLQFLWARETADQLGDRTPDEVRRRWKLEIGVPILREQSSEFREVYDKAIKPLPYHMKMEAMRFIPVTSEMKVPQMVEYLDTVQRESLELGIRLTDPDPDLAKYHERYRRKAAA